MYPSVKQATRDARGKGILPQQSLRALSGAADDRECFPTSQRANDVCRGASTSKEPGMSGIDAVQRRFTSERERAAVDPRFARFEQVIQRITQTTEDIIISLWTHDSIRELLALTTGNGKYLLSVSPISMDPKFNNDEWLLM